MTQRLIRHARRLVLGFFAASLLHATWFEPAAAQPARKVTPEDLPRVPHTASADALKTFQVANGFQLELVAAEPLVADPVDACFDEFGRMYVAEMHGYPFSQEPTRLYPSGGGKRDAGIIRLLEDTDGDGRMDKSVVFADRISWPTSVCCYDGGLFVLAPQYLYYFKDTSGDNRADVREVVLSGFGRQNVQGLANNLKWALDNRIYFAAGRNEAKLLHRGEPLFGVGGRDLRFDPRTEEFEPVTGGLQFGHSMDDWGNRFVCSNSNHIQQVIFPQEYLARNPYLAVSGLVRSIAADGASARVFRASPPEPWRIIRQKWRAEAKGYKLVINEDGSWEFLPLDPSKEKGVVPTEYPVGYFTSATGITIYRGGAYPAEYRGNAFVGDVGGNLIHRKLLEAKGVAQSAERADQNEEFVRSSDNWFRPVNFVNAPDGTLYVLDMYRETVEHPYSIPEEIKQFLHLESGSDRGRIYRIVSPQMKRIRPPRLGELSSAELVAQLKSDHSWNRETAQRLLWQRQDKTVGPLLEALVRSSDKPLARLHALYTLDGLALLAPRQLESVLRDPHPRLREHAIRLSEAHLAGSPQLLDALLALHDDADDRVRFQLAFSLGEARHARVIEGLALLARDPRNGGAIQTALLSSVADQADQLVAALLADSEFLQQQHAGALLSELGLIVGAHPDPALALGLLALATAPDLSGPIQQTMLTSLGEGLSRRGSSVPRLLADHASNRQLRSQVQQVFQRAARLAHDADQPLVQRAAAMGLLAFADFETSAKHLPQFLTPQVPQALQRAAVAALAQQESDQVGKLLIQDWRTFSPQIRRDVVDAMTSTVGRIRMLLAAVESQAIGRGDLEQDKRQLLLNHPHARIRAESQRLLGGDVSSDRAEVVAEYQPVLDLDADTGRGLQVFKKTCSVCHRVGGVGHQVAPDLASVQNKSLGDLLVAILDPSREAQPNFNTYNVITEDGRIFTGMIATETANSITLRRAEGKEDVILRSNIEELISTGKSLMPEGLEKDLSPQDLADVIAFVKTIKPGQTDSSANSEIQPLVRVIDLNVGQSQTVELADGTSVNVQLLDLDEQRDDLRGAVRAARATVAVNGTRAELVSATYHLPTTVAGVQIDCSITKGYNSNGRAQSWGLDKDARLRLWPANSPLLRPGTFGYPVKQSWFASDTQMANEPVHVDGVEQVSQKQNIYYHNGLDIGGAEGLVEVVAATDGLVVSSGLNVLDGNEQDTPVRPRYDVVYVRDARGWYYRYSHLKEIDKTIVPGRVLKLGDRIGLLGKEGGSGGWSHLHFGITSRQPSGKWGTQEGYAFLWEAYLKQYAPPAIAVARPHQLVWSGDTVTLDASKSWSACGKIVEYQWQFGDGTTATGQRVQRAYEQPGRYSAVLKITDAEGHTDYEFAVVQVIDRRHPDRRPPGIHAAYAPTFGVRSGDEVTFKVRTFGTTDGEETWDFGDGTPTVKVRSDGNVTKLAPDGYAVTTHRFENPGHYIVRVKRTDRHGYPAISHMDVRVE